MRSLPSEVQHESYIVIVVHGKGVFRMIVVFLGFKNHAKHFDPQYPPAPEIEK